MQKQAKKKKRINYRFKMPIVSSPCEQKKFKPTEYAA